MMRTLVIAALLLTGCSRGGSTTDVPDDRFIETIVELRRAAVENPGGFASAKQQILSDNGVTEEALRAYIHAHADDLGRLASVWDSINARLMPPAQPIE